MSERFLAIVNPAAGGGRCGRLAPAALDRVRQACARRLNLIRDDDRRFLWVTDFPMFEEDPSNGALAAEIGRAHV